MDDSCVVCAETLEWVAYGQCGHREVCSTCIARLRFICDDHSCCLCKSNSNIIFVTKRVEKAIKEKTCNALLLKVNQIGSVTESIEAVKMSKRAGWGVMASHCSSETKDTFIADLSVGLSTGQIKTGAPCRSERLAKYNQV